METELVSICIPVYNNELFIEQSIGSAISQTYSNIEIIIIDDASTDKSKTIIQSLIKKYPDKNIKFLCNEKNIGLVANWNKCIEHSSGEFISFLHGDDIYAPNIISEQIYIYRKNKEVGAIFTLADIINEKNIKISEISLPKVLSNKNYIFNKIDIFKALLIETNTFIMCPSAMIKKTCFFQCGYFDSKFKHAVDLDMWLRILEHNKIAIIPEKLMQHRFHKKQSTSNYHNQRIKFSEFFFIMDTKLNECQNDISNDIKKIYYVHKTWDLIRCLRNSIIKSNSNSIKENLAQLNKIPYMNFYQKIIYIIILLYYKIFILYKLKKQ